MNQRQPRPLTPVEQAALDKVRRRVGAIVFGVVAMHAILALIVLSRLFDKNGRSSDATGLLIMVCLISAFQYVGVRLILGKPLKSPVWIVLAALPATFGFLLR